MTHDQKIEGHQIESRSLDFCVSKNFAGVELGFSVLTGIVESAGARIIDSEQEIKAQLATAHPNKCCVPLMYS